MGCRGYYDEMVTLEENLLMSLGKYAFRLQKMEYCINYSDDMRRLLKNNNNKFFLFYEQKSHYIVLSSKEKCTRIND